MNSLKQVFYYLPGYDGYIIKTHKN